MPQTVVLYHNDCFDGFSGAWAAWKKLGTHATYIGVEHQKPPPPGLKGALVYLIDFSYSEKVMRDLRKMCKQLVALDHHKSHEQAVKIAHHYRFSLIHSGCMLAWQYFHPNKKPPRFLEAVQDNDLFVFRKVSTREVVSYAGTLSQDFKTWDGFMKAGEYTKKRREIISLGKTLLWIRKKAVQKLLPFASKVLFEGYRTLAINSPVYYSELANQLYSAMNAPFGISWHVRGNDLHISLRSTGEVDVSLLATRYGGGGHAGAAGFTIPLKKGFPWKFLKTGA